MATTPNYSQPAIFSEVSTPTAPDSGYLKVYANSGTLLINGQPYGQRRKSRLLTLGLVSGLWGHLMELQ